jgi:hypothetical protein
MNSEKLTNIFTIVFIIAAAVAGILYLSINILS